MSALKCKNCGLVNFATAEICKRCGLSLHGDSRRVTDFGADSLEGVWQDDGLLVMRLDTRLPNRCIKCNSEEGVRHKVVKATAYSHWKLPFALFFQIIPPRLLVYLFRQVSVEVALCRKHSSKWRRNLRINLPLTAIGFGLLVLGFYSRVTNPDIGEDPLAKYLGFSGLMLFIIGALSCVVGGDAVYLKRRASGCVWLKGAGQDYLASLPRLR
jgi:hypothetical protein